MGEKNRPSLTRRPRRFCRCKNSILRFRKIAIALILGFPLLGELYSYESTTKLSKGEIMFERIGKGINVDVSRLEGGPPEKVLYDPAQSRQRDDAVKAAGFQSIPCLLNFGKPGYRTRLTETLLKVVICLWGSGQWASKPKEGIQEFVQSAVLGIGGPGFNLVFELWNEPAGLIVEPGGIQGIKDGKTVMEYLNAAIPIIRTTNPDRTLGIGGPGFNGGRELEEFVTPEYLTYRLEDGSGFVADECKKHNIGWMYYCAGFNNQWAFNILNTEDGWNQDALDILTEVTAPPPPPMSPLINSEFSSGTDHWTGEGSVQTSVARSAGLSGLAALKVEIKKSDRAEIYQETPKREWSPPGRYLISLRKGRLYKISFLAKSVGGMGTLKVRLADVSGSSDGFWTSTPVTISNAKREYTIEYKHTGRDVRDVRVAFLFGDRDQVILLDRIALHGYRE